MRGVRSGRSGAARWGLAVLIPAASGARSVGKQHAGKPHGDRHGCVRIDKKLQTYRDWPKVRSRIGDSKKLEARVRSMLSK